MVGLRDAALLLLLAAAFHCSGSLAAGTNWNAGSSTSPSAPLKAGDARARGHDGLATMSALSGISAITESGPLSDDVSGLGRSLLHGCHGKNNRIMKKCAFTDLRSESLYIAMTDNAWRLCLQILQLDACMYSTTLTSLL